MIHSRTLALKGRDILTMGVAHRHMMGVAHRHMMGAAHRRMMGVTHRVKDLYTTSPERA